MMVVGRRRIPVTQRLFNGSVSCHLVAAADRPVVVVPDSHSPINELGPIVVGVSESRAALAAVEWASRRAVRRNGELLLVNAYPAEATICTDVGTDETISSRGSLAVSALLLDRAASLARETAGPSLLTRRLSVPGTAERALLEACAHGALLVLGRHRRSWPGHRVGYIVGFVMRHAELPIAVIPDQAKPESPRQKPPMERASLPPSIPSAR
jgi:nucleotide-binding universal stress UspA family protein